MTRRRRLPPPPPPDGYMWLHWKLMPIAEVEFGARYTMSAFDRIPHLFGDEHWRNDPSYDWAAQTKRNKEVKPMSIKVYQEDCPGCKPAAMDMKTGQVLPDDHPLAQQILRAWGQTTLAQRKAWHKVTCLNSTDPLDLLLAQQFVSMIQQP
jgi:hypothetical protein